MKPLRKIITGMMFGFICHASWAADEFALLREEKIGNLLIDLPEKEVRKAISCKEKRGPDQLWGADGAYHQEWAYADCGITLDMVSDKKQGAKKIASITLFAPSTLNTQRGIRIGSSTQEVMKAYKPYWNKEESDSNQFVAGSIYGGLIFTHKKKKVNGIFLGATAE
ncbi:hypothetical protein [Janthinobacterium sp. B9-8]|uniref:hypothetical protein n=1 Tax=Janthinobacterium sp. B9-8 TaxID=1236179 RepID=UPI00061D393E|nr:hypothetical protein [Janthinobacterium sp. B9-8]AMC35843.1 hypothetical protein VN23_15135 [Janthinobacterium sp. B9-8]